MLLPKRTTVASGWEDVQEARRQGLVHRLTRLESGGRQGRHRRAVPGEVAADDFVLAGRAGELVILPR